MSVTRRGEKSFLDLPNEVIIEVFKYLNLPTRLRMRLNKRLDKIALGLKNAENIGNITLTVGFFVLIVQLFLTSACLPLKKERIGDTSTASF